MSLLNVHVPLVVESDVEVASGDSSIRIVHPQFEVALAIELHMLFRHPHAIGPLGIRLECEVMTALRRKASKDHYRGGLAARDRPCRLIAPRLGVNEPVKAREDATRSPIHQNGPTLLCWIPVDGQASAEPPVDPTAKKRGRPDRNAHKGGEVGD